MSTSAVRFPSFEFLEALQARASENPQVFESIPSADTYFAVGIGDLNYGVEVEGREYIGLARGVNLSDVEFALLGAEEIWSEMFRNIVENRGADDSHSLEALVGAHGGLEIAGELPAARDAYASHAAWIQAFFDLAKDVELELE